MKCWSERGRDLERFTRDYWDLNRTFNPLQFDPDAWAQMAQDAGMRYVTFTTKHHDGFCMFDTATTDYRVTHASCPFHHHPRANITREVFDAFRKQGLAISCYFSFFKYVPDDPYKPPSEVARMRDEILTKGGNLLLGVGPDAQGVIPPEAARCLHEMGRLW